MKLHERALGVRRLWCVVGVSIGAVALLATAVAVVGPAPAAASARLWIQVGPDIDGEAALDGFGRSVALSADGTVLAIGGPGNEANGRNAGHVRVFERTDNVWTQVGPDIDGEAAGDGSGRSVALSADGTVLAIGAPENDGNLPNAGHVRVFERTGNTWIQVGPDIDGESGGNLSGSSVALSADGATLAVGAPRNGGNGTNSGHVRVFARTDNNWTQIGRDIDGQAEFNRSGRALALSADGTMLVIGAARNAGNGRDAGHFRVFERTDNDWAQVGRDIRGAHGDFFGSSVALSADGTILAVGATEVGANLIRSGYVRVFERTGNTWTQIGLDIDGERVADLFGTSVALSADGTILAIGAPGLRDRAPRPGNVRVLERTGNTWTQIGPNLDGEADFDESGRSVALSADGTTLAIGAPGNDGPGMDRGHVRMFQFGDVVDPAVIGNRVWDDLDGDGLQDAGEPGVAGVRVDVLDGDTVVHTVTTNAQGRWTQPVDPSVEWKVQVHAPAGRSFTIRDAGTNDNRDSDVYPLGRTARIPVGTLASGVTNDSFDAGLAPAAVADPAVIGNRVWDDLDGDGVQDADEPGVAGVRVDVLDGDTVVHTVTTNAQGRWTQPVDPSVEWKVQVHAPAGRSFTIRDAGTNDNRDSDVYPLGRTARIPVGTLSSSVTNDSFDAGLAPAAVADPAVIGNRVWDDLDGNGRQNAGEPGVAGVRVDLRLGAVVVHTVTTGTNGRWSQPVDPSVEWRVQVHAPPGRSFTTRNAGTNDNIDSDVFLANGVVVIPVGTLVSGVPNSAFDAGLAPL